MLEGSKDGGGFPISQGEDGVGESVRKKDPRDWDTRGRGERMRYGPHWLTK